MKGIICACTRRALIATAALTLLGTNGLPVKADTQLVVAVLDFNDSKLKEAAAGAQINLTDMLTTAISQGTGIKVIDKETVARVKVKETAWQQSGFADPSTALTFAKELKANFVVVGSVSQASQEERETVGITRLRLTVGVEVKAMDDKTGQIVASTSAMGETNTIAAELDDEATATTKIQGLYIKAARKAIGQAGSELARKIQALKK